MIPARSSVRCARDGLSGHCAAARAPRAAGRADASAASPAFVSLVRYDANMAWPHAPAPAVMLTRDEHRDGLWSTAAAAAPGCAPAAVCRLAVAGALAAGGGAAAGWGCATAGEP